MSKTAEQIVEDKINDIISDFAKKHKLVPFRFYEKYMHIKNKYPSTILLYANNEEYHALGKDAKTVSTICGLPLEEWDNYQERKIMVCKFERHRLDAYLPLLVKNGHRTAIAEDLSRNNVSLMTVKKQSLEQTNLFV